MPFSPVLNAPALSPIQLDEQRLLLWFQQSSLVAPDGRIRSWLDRDHSGYEYDEATALVVRLFDWLGWSERAAPLRRVIQARLDANQWLQRRGTSYVFDTALALWIVEDPKPVAERVLEWLQCHQVCAPVTDPERWSQSFGPHLIKCASPLFMLGYGDAVKPVVDHIVRTCFDGERFRIHPRSGGTYVHSHCYALEGLLATGQHPDVARSGADWLARLQQSDGALPAWVGCLAEQRWPTDIVAQAIRIWAIIDREAYAPCIDRALLRLASLQCPASGGVAYSPDHPHENTWVGVFGLQAASWARGVPHEEMVQWLL